jgi:hypothetical protein
VELFLHPAVPIREVDGLAVRLAGRTGDLWVRPQQPPQAMVLEQRPGWLSRAYGHREPATVLVYSLRATLPVTLTTVLALV